MIELDERFQDGLPYCFWSTDLSRPGTLDVSKLARAAGVPPRSVVIVLTSPLNRPRYEWLGSPTTPGRSSSRRLSSYLTPVSLAISARMGDGNTSDPKIAGTFSCLICVIRSATSLADGSAKSAG